MATARPLLFLSDLHLPANPSPLRDGFLRFLAGPAREASAVYLLGDIFESWIGDDVGLDIYVPEVAALRALTGAGVAVHFMHGNRDFLVGRGFAQATGASLLDDPWVITHASRRLLLSHGDFWCTDDHAYQRWRRFARNRLAQRAFLALPRRWRTAIAGGLRSGSRKAKSAKPVEIMDVNVQAVAQDFRKYGVEWVIHGHTHRPATHPLRVDGRSVERIVLADWSVVRMEYLHISGCQMQRILLS